MSRQGHVSCRPRGGVNLAMANRMEEIYERPADYDLEHAGDDEDVDFYVRLVERLQAGRVLELASGSGRVTIPLAKLAARLGCDVVALDTAETMLAEAECKSKTLNDAARQRLSFVRADLRCWRSATPFDVIFAPCASLSHLLTIEDQIEAWSSAHANLAPGGRFVVDVTMPNLAVYAESMQAQPRTLVELDVDTIDPVSRERLLRYKTTRYVAHEQRAEIRFLYDKFSNGDRPDRYVSDFDSHVYYPRELELLFRLTGFTVEHRYGDYHRRPLRSSSRVLVMIGRRA